LQDWKPIYIHSLRRTRNWCISARLNDKKMWYIAFFQGKAFAFILMIWDYFRSTRLIVSNIIYSVTWDDILSHVIRSSYLNHSSQHTKLFRHYMGKMSVHTWLYLSSDILTIFIVKHVRPSMIVIRLSYDCHTISYKILVNLTKVIIVINVLLITVAFDWLIICYWLEIY